MPKAQGSFLLEGGPTGERRRAQVYLEAREGSWPGQMGPSIRSRPCGRSVPVLWRTL